MVTSLFIAYLGSKLFHALGGWGVLLDASHQLVWEKRKASVSIQLVKSDLFLLRRNFKLMILQSMIKIYRGIIQALNYIIGDSLDF